RPRRLYRALPPRAVGARSAVLRTMGGARAPGQSRARRRRLSTLRARGLRGRRPVEPGVKTLYVVDGHSQLFRAYHAVGYLSTSKGIPTQAVLILSTMLWKLCREEQPDYLAVAWDPPGPTFRDALSAEYKATRAAMPDDLVRQLPYVKRLFEALRIPVIEVAGFEADDVLATLVARALELATLNRDVPLAFDLETARRREPDWTKLRALWMELEFTRLLKDLPAPVAAVSGAPVTVLPDRAAVAAWLASLPAGAPLALDWAGNARPPDPRLAGIAVFHPAAGAARVPSPDAVALGDREVRV